MQAAGLNFTPQYELWDGWMLVARFDLADKDVKLAVELDGPSHASYDAKRKDRRRDRQAYRFGWVTARYLITELTNMDAFVADVVALRETLLSGRGRAA